MGECNAKRPAAARTRADSPRHFPRGFFHLNCFDHVQLCFGADTPFGFAGQSVDIQPTLESIVFAYVLVLRR
jgi:hypothetical protein